MILELLAFGLIASAFLAVHLDDAIYSVVSLAGALVSMAILYSLSDATFAAVFQLAIGVGTLAVLFLSSEMLSEKQDGRKSLKNVVLALAAALLLSTPSVFISTGTVSAIIVSDISFPEALWNLRSIDVILQGVVIMSVALGIAIILQEKRGRES